MSNYIRKTLYEKKDIEFVSIDSCSKINVLNYIYINTNHKFYPGDINDINMLNVFLELEKPDIILHAAAETNTGFTEKDISRINSTNIIGTQNLISMAIKHKVKNFILLSSDDVYGQLSSVSKTPWKEDSNTNPRNPYAASKVCAETLLKTACEYSDLKYNILRLSSVYGPRQLDKFLIPKLTNSILNDKMIDIYGTGSNIRDWTHVYDICTAINTIVLDGKLNETYNVSSQCELSNIEIHNDVCKILNKGWDKVNFIEDKISHDFRRAMSSDKLQQLGWQPKIKFKDGISNTVSWIKDNQWFYKV